jgi:beta-carotene 15,15'-monooxygenase
MDRALGFHSVDEEHDTDLAVEGSLPDWLSGSLIRNGPGSFETAAGEVDHWFDGFAMLRQFSFDGGGVRYRNRFLRTDAYEAARRGEFAGGFGTSGGSLLSRLKSFVLDDPYDNTNVIAERIGDEYVALTESTRWAQFDATTLETLGSAEYDGDVPAGNLACAHVHRDPWTGDTLTVETSFGRTSTYHVHELSAPTERRHVASIPTDEPAYIHSFAATRNYVVLVEFPFVVNPLDFFRPGDGTFIERYRWEPERGTTFHVVDRRTGETVAAPVTDPFFAFHHVNAYEPSTGTADLVLDVETVPDAEAVETLYLDELGDGFDTVGGRLDRFRVTLDGSNSGAAVDRDRVYGGGIGLPVVSPEVRMREHRYVYAQRFDDATQDWATALVKIDAETGDVREFARDGWYPSEPVFVPAPDARRDPNDPDGSTVAPEDDGVLLSVVLDRDAERSFLLALDGATMDERARAPLPHPLPFDFHGRYFPEV